MKVKETRKTLEKYEVDTNKGSLYKETEETIYLAKFEREEEYLCQTKEK